MKVGVSTSIGLTRTINQDSYLISNKKDRPFYCIVADGMGGHNAGEIASRMATEEIARLLDSADFTSKTPREVCDLLGEAFLSANKKVFTSANTIDGCKGMGTTATVAMVIENTLYIAHVGDSRAYFAEDGSLKKLTQDHTVVADLVLKGDLTKKQALTDTRRHMITRAVGAEHLIKADTYSFDYLGQSVLLCSDGLYNMISNSEIYSIISSTPDMQEAADKLVLAANNAGGSDNITAILFCK